MVSELAKQIQPSSTLAITAKAKELKAQGVDVVGFGAGEPDFDTPDYIKKAAITAIEEGFTNYTPAAGTPSLKVAIAGKLKRDNGVTYEASQIVVSNGAKHSLVNTFMAILNPGDEVLIPSPYWLSYPEMVKMAGGIAKTVYTKKENGFKMGVEELEAAITPRTKAIIINSPSNPTGVVYTRDELKVLAEYAVSKGIWIISDEIYEYLVYGDTKHTCIASLSDEIYKKTITINGVSKGFAMTGWRIGYIAAPQPVATAISNIQSHATSNPNSIAQKAAEAAIGGDLSFVKEMVKAFSERSEYMYTTLKGIEGFEVVKPEGAFYCFVDISMLYDKKYKGKVIDSAATFAALLLEEEKVALVPCKDFEAPDCIRLSYAISLEQIKKGLERIKQFVDQLK